LKVGEADVSLPFNDEQIRAYRLNNFIAIDHEEFNVQFDGTRLLKARFCPVVQGVGICKVDESQAVFLEELINADTPCNYPGAE